MKRKYFLAAILLTLTITSLFINKASTNFNVTDSEKFDTGDTAWMIVASALVLLMTPGLGFFYGGMVGKKKRY